jgi:hypothetical protein
MMKDKPTMEKVEDQLEQLLLKILLSALKRLMNDIVVSDDENKMKF